MSGSRFKNFSESNNNKYIFISENKILYDKSEKSYKFDANYLILEGDIDTARIGIYHDDDEYIYAVNLKDITLVNKPEDADLIDLTFRSSLVNIVSIRFFIKKIPATIKTSNRITSIFASISCIIEYGFERSIIKASIARRPPG